MSDVTQLLGAIQQGDPKAAEELLPLVYEESRRLAACKMTNEAAGQTLQPTDKARSKNRLRHGQGLSRINIDQVDVAVDSDDETFLRVDAASKKLTLEDPGKAELINFTLTLGEWNQNPL